nr:MAG TPA: hypothetical protein [Caudoviricetes sp.]
MLFHSSPRNPERFRSKRSVFEFRLPEKGQNRSVTLN